MAIRFDGVTGGINCGSDTSLDNKIGAAFSISAWIRPQTRGEGNAGAIVSKRVAGNNGWVFGFSSGVTNSLQFLEEHNTSNFFVECTANTVRMTTSNHVVFTTTGAYTRAGSNIYVNTVSTKDGAAGSDGAGGSSGDASQNLFIGNLAADANTFNGDIVYLALFKKVLSNNEIQLIYGGNRTPKPLPGSLFDADLISYWAMSEDGAGVVNSSPGYVKDTGGINTNNGTQSGDPVYVQNWGNALSVNNLRPRVFAPGLAR